MNPFYHNKYMRVLYPLIMLAIGLGIYAMLVKNRAGPVKSVTREAAPLVKVLTAESTKYRVTVKGTGTVKAKKEITIVPQVSGIVTYADSKLSAGAFFKEGELLFKIEDADYRLATQKAEASKARAEYELTQMESRAKVARLEWERLDGMNKEEPSPLLLYTPQLKNAQASLKAAEAALEETRLALKRTGIHAPFNCRIRSESIDLGQFVRAGTAVMDISGTDEAEVIVSLPLEELKWISIPEDGGKDGHGSQALVTLKAGEDLHRWKGRVVRSTGEVDPKDRMTRVVVSVKDPYGSPGGGGKKTLTGNSGGLTLQEGAFVDLSIEGTWLTGVFRVKRSSVREGGTLWVATPEERLSIRKVKVVRKGRGEIIISGGIKDGERIITTFVGGVTEGMKITVRKGDGY